MPFPRENAPITKHRKFRLFEENVRLWRRGESHRQFIPPWARFFLRLKKKKLVKSLLFPSVQEMIFPPGDGISDYVFGSLSKCCRVLFEACGLTEGTLNCGECVRSHTHQSGWPCTHPAGKAMSNFDRHERISTTTRLSFCQHMVC